ncbi:hypothetical protein [Pantoea sp. GbtcB22]|uniref:hypothetical protein n=1 Tax=Pantoea sp. GbtcB22 TaxID=2824767 RepID=UPI001C304522|nr:hypothetical protein [Pantoea sp. GbtcB22]
MNNEFVTKRIIEIDEELELLIYNPCNCDLNLEIKILAFGGGEHYVRQCNNCGRQKGGALKFADASSELNGRIPNTFDPTIEERYIDESQKRSQRFSLLHRKRSHLLYGVSTALHSQNIEKYREAYRSLSEDIDNIIDLLGVDKTLLALNQQIKRIKKERKELSENLAPVFSSEDDLKTWMINTLKNDFHIYQEVVGTHVTEGLKVRIDYVIYPKAHLLNHGFEPAPFGIEVKYLNQEKDFAHKASRGIWQSISYNDCEFSINNKKFRLKFCLLFSNISFINETEILKLNSDHVDEKYMKWVGMLNVANHAKVGALKITGTKDRVKGWSMQFAGGVYFSHQKK